MKQKFSEEEAQDALGRLISALKILPGIGPKSAQRMTYVYFNMIEVVLNYLVKHCNLLLRIYGHCRLCNSFRKRVM
jgi:recombination protein RecR